MESWIETITIKTLLKFAPHGFLMGCGETSEYMAYMARTKPLNEKDLFQSLRQGYYFNSSINEMKYKLHEMDLAISEIDKRLSCDGYVRVSFECDEIEESIATASTSEIVSSFMNILHNHPPPKLFDHSFALFKTDSIWRFESYIDQYAPRNVMWNTYNTDLHDIVLTPLESWARIFGVRCETVYESTSARVVVHS